MATDSAPGVDVEEVDASFFIASSSNGKGIMVGWTQKGPLSTPTLCTTWADYTRTFGTFVSTSMLPYCAKRALDAGAPIYIIREDHKVANVHQSQLATIPLPSIGGAPSPAVLASGVGPFQLAVGDLIGIKHNGGGAVDSTPVAATQAQLVAGAGTYSLTDNVSYLSFRVGGPTAPLRKITFHAADFVSMAAATAAEVTAVLNRDLAGVEVSVVSTHFVIKADRFGTGSYLQLVGADSNGTLTAFGLSVSAPVGAGNVANLDAVTAAELAALFTPVGFAVTVQGGALVFTSTDTGAGATLQADASSTSGTTAAKLALSTTLVTGGATTAVPTITVNAKDQGLYGNSVAVVTSLATNDPVNKFALDVQYQGVDGVESYDELSMDPTSARYFVPIINGSSNYIQVIDLLESTIVAPGNRPATGSYTLAGGSDAVGSMTVTDIVGDETSRTGVWAADGINDAEIILTPGWNTLDLLSAVDAYCQQRKDLWYVHFIPNGLNLQQCQDYRNAASGYSSFSKLDSSYSAMYFGWLKITDPLTSQSLAIPGDGDILQICLNETFPWQAPAGSARAKVTGSNGVVLGLTRAQVGVLYAVGINCIYPNKAVGLVVYGQKTLLVEPSAENRISTRRLLIELETSIGPSLEPMVFEPNTAVTWNRITRGVERFMDGVQKNGGVVQYEFICDQTTTTTDDQDNERLNMDLFIKPTPTAEFLRCNIIVTDQGYVFATSKQSPPGQ